jgi:class 3 adenylate cyclase
VDPLAKPLAKLARQILDRLKTGERAYDLLQSYHTDSPEHRRLWGTHPELYLPFVKGLILEGHPSQALDLARERKEFLTRDLPPGSPDRIPEGYELRYLHALAANRGGNPHHAGQLLKPLLEVACQFDRNTDEMPTWLRVDILALRGSLLKDLSRRDPQHIKPAIAAYEEAANVPGAADLPDGGTFPLINMATMLRVAGKKAAAKQLAEKIILRVKPRLAEALRQRQFWLPATMAEACVLAGRHDDAVEWYRKTLDKAEAIGAYGDIGAALGNLLRLREVKATKDPKWIEDQIGRLVVFSGHMIDSPQRLAGGLPPRFPNHPDLIRAVDQAIRERLDELNATVGFCSLACGSDILFARAMLDREAELHVVLPFAENDFVRTSVDFGLPDPAMEPWRRWFGRDPVMRQWWQWFQGILGNLPRDNLHYATTESYLETHELFDFVNTFTQGLAVLRARQRVVRPTALVVHDTESPGGGDRGTEYFLGTWQKAGVKLAELKEAKPIRLDEIRKRVPMVLPDPTGVRLLALPAEPGVGGRPIKTILFADVAKFSGIPERLLSEFFDRYIGFLKHAFRTVAGKKAVFANTWGDGLYVVFDAVPDAAEFALGLLERATDRGGAGAVDWARFGMGEGVPLRIALHTGPVFEVTDLFQDRPAYSGQHVNRAARIEPVTVRGCVYASEQFAAHLVMLAPDRFGCEFVGVQTLPKGYDRCPLYRVTRA